MSRPGPDPGPLADLMPEDPVMAAAWLGSLRFALGRPDFVAAFRAETGNTYMPGATPLESAIDDASGATLGFLRAFAGWHNANVWGEDEDGGGPVDVHG